MASLGGGREIGFVVGRRRVEGVCGCIEFGRVVGIGCEMGEEGRGWRVGWVRFLRARVS